MEKNNSKTNYRMFLNKAKTGRMPFDSYIEVLSDEMMEYDHIDPYKKDALKPIVNKADAFLRRHAGISYEEFLRQSNPEKFTENDFGKLPEKRNLKRRLFVYRSMLYLSSLEECERRGYNIEEIISQVEQEKIPYIKKEKNEPTFNEILKALHKRD